MQIVTLFYFLLYLLTNRVISFAGTKDKTIAYL
jgi:hypothetical protein